MEYTELTPERQQEIVRHRIAHYEAEHLSHALVLEALEASAPSAERDRAITEAHTAMAACELAAETCRTHLS